MENFRIVALPDFTSHYLVDSGSSGGHSQWANIHLSIRYFPQESQGCVCFDAQKAKLNPISEALAASTVKVAGRDVLGSWKVLISLGAAPLLYGLYAFIAAAVMVRAGAPLKYRLWTPFIVVSALPFIGYAALKFGEAGMDVLKYDPELGLLSSRQLTHLSRSLRPLIVSLAPGQARTLSRLKVMREELAGELATSINEFGPKMYEDFDQVSISGRRSSWTWV